MKFLLTFLFFIFLNINLFAQATAIKEIDYLHRLYGFAQSAHVGHKLIFGSYKYPIWETDGTAEGTQKLDLNITEGIAFFQISNDSLIIGVSFNKNSRYDLYLYTSTMDAPQKIATTTGKHDFNFNTKKIGNQLVHQNKQSFNFINLTTFEVDKRFYPDLNDIPNNWVVMKDSIYFVTDNFLFSIDLHTHELYRHNLAIEEFPSRLCLLPNKNKLLLKFGSYPNIKIWAYDGSALTYIEGIKTIPYPIVSIDDKLIYMYQVSSADSLVMTLYSTDGTIEGTKIIKIFPSVPWISAQAYYFRGKIKYNNKIYFFSPKSILWETDGTTEGTKKYENNFGVELGAFYKTHESGTIVIGQNQNHIRGTYLFNGTNDLVSLNTDNTRSTTTVLYQNYFSDSLVYLPLIDIDFGLELHQLNRRTKEVNLITDFSTYAGWSDITTIGATDKFFAFTNTKDDKTFLYISNKESLTPKRKPVNKGRNKWIEQILKPANASSNLVSAHVDQHNQTLITFSSKNYPQNIQPQFTNLFQNQKAIESFDHSYHLLKLDEHGKYLWDITIPLDPKKNALVETSTDSKGNIITAIKLSTDTTSIDGKEFLITDGELLILKHNINGILLWHQQAYIGSNGTILAISIDSKDRIILAGKFSIETATFGNISTTSPRNPTAFVAKFSDIGEAIWANNIPLPYSMPLDFGDIKMDIDSENNIVFTQRMGHDEQFWNCEEENLRYRFLINSLSSQDGHIRWSNKYTGTSFCFPADIAASPTGNIFVIGGYNGVLEFDEFKLTSDFCERPNRFLLELNGKNGDLVQAKDLDHTNSLLSQILFDKTGNYYLIGSEYEFNYFGIVSPVDTISRAFENRNWIHPNLFIEKYNTFGTLVNTEIIKQNTSFTNKFDPTYFPANSILSFAPDGDWILTSKNSAPIDSFNITAHARYKNIFSMKFTPKEDFSNEIKDGKLASNEILLSPNPATDYLYIQSTDLDFGQATVTIYAMDGKQWQPPMEQNNGFIRLNIKDLPTGSYVVVIRLKDQILEKQFVKF